MAVPAGQERTRWVVVGVVLVGLAAPVARAQGPDGEGLDAGVAPAEAWASVQRGGAWLWARVRPGPRSLLFRPEPREGWSWEPARWERGRRVAGQWRPAGPPPAAGAVWAPGHWEGRTWVDGRWREADRPGFTWAPGYVDADGHWVDGRWVERGRVVQVHAPVPELEGADVTVADGMPSP